VNGRAGQRYRNHAADVIGLIGLSVITCRMPERNALELRATAERYRALAEEGGDSLQEAELLEMADDFAREAAEEDARLVRRLKLLGQLNI
jgi:hypothetical protein